MYRCTEHECNVHKIVPLIFQFMSRKLLEINHYLDSSFESWILRLRDLMGGLPLPPERARFFFKGRQLFEGASMFEQGVIPKSTIGLCFWGVS